MMTPVFACHAQDVILMSDSCDVCGYKSSEIKGGGEIADLGRAITLRVSEQEDLRRDVIKADSATVRAAPVQLCECILFCVCRWGRVVPSASG